MHAFLDIRTVFDNKESLSIDYLLLKYKDYDYMISLVHNFVTKNISKSQILGKKILLKPNWVMHDIRHTDVLCMRTHEQLLLAMIEVIFRHHPLKVVVGDAPIQGCDMDKILSPFFLSRIEALRAKYKIPLEIKDFRRTTFNQAASHQIENQKPIEDYIIFNIGTKSYLEAITTMESTPFRVTCYNPDILTNFHKPGVHKYCIVKDIFDADIVISMPKIKTHQKTGITNALKNLVGLNGDKAYLPHHRKGGTRYGGDCYPGRNLLRKISEDIIDSANRKIGHRCYSFKTKLSNLIWALSNPKKEHTLSAGWYGNDTSWRMVCDIYHIAVYGKVDGTIADCPQRELFSLSDGIIAGQGDGPLQPEPLPLGILMFSNYAPLSDIATGILLGLNIEKIPLLMEASKMLQNQPYTIVLNDNEITFGDLGNYKVKAVMPSGWTNYEDNENWYTL